MKTAQNTYKYRFFNGQLARRRPFQDLNLLNIFLLERTDFTGYWICSAQIRKWTDKAQPETIRFGKKPPEASVIRWRVTVPYENKVLEELDIWDLQWLIFVLKPHKTSIAVDLVFFNLYLQICIIITTVKLKIKKDIVCTCYIYLRAPLIMHATKSPGRPGRSWNTSITKCGKSWNTKTTVHDRGMFIHMYTVTCFLMNNFKSCLHKKSRRKIILFFTEMRKIRISWL